MLIFVAIQAQQFPIAAITGVIIVIEILMMHGQLTQPFAAELPTTSCTDPGVDFEGSFAIGALAFFQLTAP